MRYIPTIDPGACSAHGDCVDIAPQVFGLEETAIVIGEGPDELDPRGRQSVSLAGDHGDGLRDRRDRFPIARATASAPPGPGGARVDPSD